MARLRRECAWKAGQTHESLVRYLVEETYETIEAIEAGDAEGDHGHLREELGDLLLQVYFHAAIAAERSEFGIEDVAADLVAKLRRRNPHVFGTEAERAAAHDPESINEQWERIKAEEKQRRDVMEGVPAELPALLRAVKALDRLERAGVPLPSGSAASDDLGDRLLALVIEAREAGIDPEQALRSTVRRVSQG
ncbi:MAG: MazG family protein [Nocardioidaceae bacterium]|nr:MazG family protein [Nocardioidaceae bacterium]